MICIIPCTAVPSSSPCGVLCGGGSPRPMWDPGLASNAVPGVQPGVRPGVPHPPSGYFAWLEFGSDTIHVGGHPSRWKRSPGVGGHSWNGAVKSTSGVVCVPQLASFLYLINRRVWRVWAGSSKPCVNISWGTNHMNGGPGCRDVPSGVDSSGFDDSRRFKWHAGTSQLQTRRT